MERDDRYFQTTFQKIISAKDDVWVVYDIRDVTLDYRVQ